MAERKVDKEFVRESWEAPSHVSNYVDADSEVGLRDSERLLVSRYLFKSDRVLDIGCGAGRAAIALYRLGYLTVQGVDLSAGMIERAASIADDSGYPISFEIGDATCLLHEDETFDAALFTAQGFMCIPGEGNRLKALREARRVLRPGGHFIFSTHERSANPKFASFWEEERLRWDNGTQDQRLLEFGDRIVMDFWTPIYIHIPTRDEVARIVDEAGLIVVEDAMRSDLCPDTEGALKFTTSDCRMWVAQRTK